MTKHPDYTAWPLRAEAHVSSAAQPPPLGVSDQPGCARVWASSASGIRRGSGNRGEQHLVKSRGVVFRG